MDGQDERRSPQQVDFPVAELDPVVSEPPGAGLTGDLTRLPNPSRIHTCSEKQATGGILM